MKVGLKVAQQWEINDSARDMTRKYNDGAAELNRIAKTALAINESYVRLLPSEFEIGDEAEVSESGA